MNHRLQLALSDAVDEIGAVNSLQIFMDKIYSTYSKKSTNQRELAECVLNARTGSSGSGKGSRKLGG